MRVSTANTYDNAINQLQVRQQQLAQSQEQLTSGKRVAKPGDDPTAAARAERAATTIHRTEATQRALDTSRTALTLTESAMGDATDLLQQAREAMVAAGNASYSDADRQTLAQTLQTIRDQLLQVANRTDDNGNFLLGGQGGRQPFIDMPGGVQFAGTPGQTQITDGNLPLTVDGGSVFLQAHSGNGVFETQVGTPNSGQSWIDAGSVVSPGALTGQDYALSFAVAPDGTTTYDISRNGAPLLTGQPYTSGQAITVDGMQFSISGKPANGDTFDVGASKPDLSVFDSLDQTIAELKSGSRPGTAQTQTVQRSLRDIDASLSNLLAARGNVGELLNRADMVESRNADLKLSGQTERTNAEDLDMVGAISDFQSRQTGYDAALKAYSMVQQLSLFEYMR
jgi:flagellar hook-associated protein 3 FlgL